MCDSSVVKAGVGKQGRLHQTSGVKIMRDYAYMCVQQSALTCTGTYMIVLSEAFVHRRVKMDCHTKMYMLKKTASTSVLEMELLCIHTDLYVPCR